MSHEIEITTISRTLSPIFFQDPNEEGNITCVGGMNGGVVWLVDVGAISPRSSSGACMSLYCWIMSESDRQGRACSNTCIE